MPSLTCINDAPRAARQAARMNTITDTFPINPRLLAAAPHRLLFLIGAQAQGLLISTLASSQAVAFQVALLSSFLPTFIEA